MNNVIIIRPKSRGEWLEQRKNGIGSSEIATIVGLNPYETPYQLWRRKTGLDPAKEETFAMKAGHYLEDAVARFWADETGREIIRSSAGDWIAADRERPYLQASPDRTYWIAGMPKSNGNKGILECKTTQMKTDGDDLPKHWFCQVQYQLGVSGYAQGSLAWLCSGREFGYKDMDFVPDFYAWLAEEAGRFWTDCVAGGREPEPVSAQDVLLKYSRHTDGKIVECGEEIFGACQDLKGLKDKISEMEERKAALEEKIKTAFGDAEAISYGGRTLATWKAPKPGPKFDAKAFQADHPDLAGPYVRMTQGARRFLLK